MHRLFEAVQQDRTQVPLLQSALWFVGEYGDLLADSYDDDASVKRRVGRKKEVLLKPVHYDGWSGRRCWRALDQHRGGRGRVE